MKKPISTLMLIVYMVTTFATVVSATDSIYLSNLFGDAFYACTSTGLGSSFTEEADTSADSFDGASVKLIGRSKKFFEQTITDDIRGMKVNVSFQIKMSDEMMETLNTDAKKKLKFYYQINYNDGTQDLTENAANQVSETAVSNEWQKISMDIEIPNKQYTEPAQYTGIKFYVQANSLGSVGVENEAAAWIDQISLKVIPAADELLTSVESINPTEDADGMNTGVEVLLDTAYVDEAGIASMVATLEGTAMDKSDYTAEVVNAEEGKKKIVIEFNNLTYIKDFAVNGIKDIWGRSIQNAELSIPRAETIVIAANAICGTDGKAGSVEIPLSTDFVRSDSLGEMVVMLDGNTLDASEYSANVEADGEDTVKIVIAFDTQQVIETFSVSGVKDIWGRNVNTSSAVIKNYNVKTYTRNILGNAFTNCDAAGDVAATLVGSSGFTRTLDLTTAYSGTGSIKIEGISGSNPDVIYGSVGMSRADAPDKVMVSVGIKKTDNLVMTVDGKHPVSGKDVTGENADTSATFTKVKFYAKAKYLPSGSSEEVEVVLNRATVNIDTENNDWQYVSKLITPNYSLIPTGATMTKLELVMRFEDGSGNTRIEQGSVWIDEVKMLRVPDVGEYPVSYLETVPANGSTNAPANKVVFKFSGAVEPSSVSRGTILINGTPAEATVSGTYDNAENITSISIAPVGGFKNDTEYTVSITGLTDVWGEAVTGTFSTSFTTIKKYGVTGSFVKVEGGVEGETLSGLENGDIKAKFNITNNTQSDMDVILVVAAYNGDTIEKFAVSEQFEDVAKGATQSLEATITGFTAGEGKCIKAFLWNTVAEHLMMSELKVLE